jgi:hypothetical protein
MGSQQSKIVGAVRSASIFSKSKRKDARLLQQFQAAQQRKVAKGCKTSQASAATPAESEQI